MKRTSDNYFSITLYKSDHNIIVKLPNFKQYCIILSYRQVFGNADVNNGGYLSKCRFEITIDFDLPVPNILNIKVFDFNIPYIWNIYGNIIPLFHVLSFFLCINILHNIYFGLFSRIDGIKND